MGQTLTFDIERLADPLPPSAHPLPSAGDSAGVYSQKAKGQAAVCLNNLKQMGLGHIFYVSDTGKTFPVGYNPSNFWMAVIRRDVPSDRISDPTSSLRYGQSARVDLRVR